MAKTRIGSNAQFSGGGLNNHVIIGSHSYAYSGYRKFDNTETSLLDIYTGPGYEIIQFQYTVMDDSEVANTDEARVVAKFNGVKVFVYIESARTTGSGLTRTQNAWPELLVPPLTRVEITMANITDASNLAGYACMIGRVYA